jgi:Rieske Fe-S protein
MDHSANHAAPPETPPPARRTFLHWLTYALGAIATLILGVPLVGYFVGARKRSGDWVTLGPLSDFVPDPQDESAGRTRQVTFENPNREPWDGMTAKTDVFVRCEGVEAKDGARTYRVRVFAVNCAHLGCPVSWFPQSGLFMCPCHGGVYYANGARASGPPPRGLFRCECKAEEGKLRIKAPHYPTLQDTLGGDGEPVEFTVSRKA